VTELPGNCCLRRLPRRGDDRGSLIAIEALRDVPFAIERIYYIFGTGHGAHSGFRAHRNLRQMAICVSGSCALTLDDGRERREVVLDDPSMGLEIGPMIRPELQRFSENAVLVVLASGIPEEADQIPA
jgi:hypothetical protein